MRAGKPIARWISTRSETNTANVNSNTVPTCESLVRYAFTLWQNAEVCSGINVTQSIDCDVILLSLSNMGCNIMQRLCTV
jgi:hypothetical protein